MKKIIASSSMVFGILALVAGATFAYFSDTERSRGNTLAAGEIDLGIDNESYYNGAFNPGTSWELDFDINEPEARFFFNFLDLKPGDWGEDTISLHVSNNDAWACMDIDITDTDDNGVTEPESKDGDTTTDEGELQTEVRFVWWADDGDNVLESDEDDGAVFSNGPMSDIDGLSVALADSSGSGILADGPLDGSATYYIGKAWCFGNLELVPVAQDGQGKTGSNGPTSPRGPGIACNGEQTDNTTQTDSVEASISFMAVQSRHNAGFRCAGGDIGCNDEVDVMLVLDRSGSIDAGELTQLKNAANAFVDALAPTSSTVHIGQSSFSTTGSLDTQLTGVEATIEVGIAALVSGGQTNLSAGINLATTELGPTSGRDRDDTTSPDIMVIVTDGNPNQPTSSAVAQLAAANAAQAARDAGIEVFVVGVGGSDLNDDYLRDLIADDAAHYFAVTEFSGLQAILENIAQCSEEETP